MWAIDASLLRHGWWVGCLGTLLWACTDKNARQPVATDPVAAPTSTAAQDSNGGTNSLPEPAKASEPEVPFDGSAPEALPTPAVTVGGETGSGTSQAHQATETFDIYAELWKQEFKCREAQP